MAEQGSPASLQKVIFDTDVLIGYLRGHEKSRRFIEAVTHERRALSSLTFMELLQGCRNQEQAREVKAFVAANIAASALETASSLATANVKHYRVITSLNLIQFKP